MFKIFVHGRNHRDHRHERIFESRLPGVDGVQRLLGGDIQTLRRAEQNFRFGQGFAQAETSVAVQIHRQADIFFNRAIQDGFGERVEEVARAFERCAVGKFQRPLNRFGVFRGGRARVQPAVVIGKRRHARDDAFIQFVMRVRFEPIGAHGIEQGFRGFGMIRPQIFVGICIGMVRFDLGDGGVIFFRARAQGRCRFLHTGRLVHRVGFHCAEVGLGGGGFCRSRINCRRGLRRTRGENQAEGQNPSQGCDPIFLHVLRNSFGLCDEGVFLFLAP